MANKRGSGIVAEFKAFALRGSVIDLAVGVIIGGAFQKIVSSVVGDLLMPLVGLVTGGMNFDEQFLVMKVPEGIEVPAALSLAKAKELGITTLNYGAFLTAVIDFLIMAVVIFLLVKGLNRLAGLRRKAEEPAPAPQRQCPYCRMEIADDASRCPHCTSVLAEAVTGKDAQT